jgi:hypothetical protein
MQGKLHRVNGHHFHYKLWWHSDSYQKWHSQTVKCEALHVDEQLINANFFMFYVFKVNDKNHNNNNKRKINGFLPLLWNPKFDRNDDDDDNLTASISIKLRYDEVRFAGVKVVVDNDNIISIIQKFMKIDFINIRIKFGRKFLILLFVLFLLTINIKTLNSLMHIVLVVIN